MRLCVVMPAYNEAQRIDKVIKRLKNNTNNIIVIDDGSTDNTAEVAELAGAEVFKNRQNRGPGYATRRGLLIAYKRGADITATMDSDGQHLPEELPRILSKAQEGYDVVFSYREYDKSKMPWIRRILNLGTNLIVKTITGKKLKDPLCGFRAFSRKAIEQLELYHDGHPFVPGVAINTMLLGLPYAEVPITCVYNEKPAIYKPSDFFKAFTVYLHYLWVSRSRVMP